MDAGQVEQLRTAVMDEVRARVKEKTARHREEIKQLRTENNRLNRELSDTIEQRDTAIRFADGLRKR